MANKKKRSKPLNIRKITINQAKTELEEDVPRIKQEVERIKRQLNPTQDEIQNVMNLEFVI